MAQTFYQILKIFFFSVNLNIPEYLRNQANLKKWMVFLKTILDAPVPPELEAFNESEDEARLREKNIHWKLKKYCGRILQRFIQKYGNKKSLLAEDHSVADDFIQNYSLPFLESFMTFLFKKNTLFVSRKTIHFSLKYIFYALKIENSFIKLHPHLEKILFDVALPLCFLTEKDNQCWQEDPEEYIRKEDDFTAITTNNKNTAMELIEAICKRSDP